MGSPLPADLPPASSLADPRLPAEPPAGLPSDLPGRRPDIRSAEHALRAATAAHLFLAAHRAFLRFHPDVP